MSLSGENIFSLATPRASFTIQGQTKVYELITKIEWTNQSTRNALSEIENLIIKKIQKIICDRQIIRLYGLGEANVESNSARACS